MSRQPRVYGRDSQPRYGARRVLTLISLAALLVLAWLALRDGNRDPGGGAGSVQLVVERRVVARRSVEGLRGIGPRALSRWLDRVPAMRRDNRGRAVITFNADRSALRRAVLQALREGGGRVVVPERAISASIELPVVKQAFRNNCETAALSMLLDARGVRLSQLRLQRELPLSPPLDPEPSYAGGLRTWGDPNRGFVGRVDGGGTSGGYGVYQGPVRRLAQRHGVQLEDISGSSEAKIYGRLLAGRPVMVWIGLSEGPYETWRSPEGRRITGNFGEHTVVLTGIRGDELTVNDPLVGVRTTWTRDDFRELWDRLGRRALAL
jgi:uncharacterized protein YvpB